MRKDTFMKKLSTQDVMKLAIKAGAEVISEKGEQSGTCEAKTIFLKKTSCNCNIKLSYVKIGDRLIDVQSECCCNKYGQYVPISEDCLINKLPNK